MHQLDLIKNCRREIGFTSYLLQPLQELVRSKLDVERAGGRTCLGGGIQISWGSL